MINTSSPYCDFIDTNTVFNHKKVYQCEYCGLKLGLENENARILCFKKMQDFKASVQKLNDPTYSDPIHLKPDDIMQNVVLDEAIKKYGKSEPVKPDDPKNLCSDEQIQQRLQICSECDHYKDNSCLLCGCVVVREINYMNKLAHKDQKCPIDKWLPVT